MCSLDTYCIAFQQIQPKYLEKIIFRITFVTLYITNGGTQEPQTYQLAVFLYPNVSKDCLI